MVNRAVLERRSAPLAGSFGLDWATKLFGADVIAQIPEFTRGANKGRKKGFVIWFKVRSGGWHHNGVIRGGIASAYLALSSEADRDAAIKGEWLGCMHSLAGDADVLFEEGREKGRVTTANRYKAAHIQIIHDAHARGIVDGSLGINDNRFAAFDERYPGVAAAWEKGRSIGADNVLAIEIIAQLLPVMKDAPVKDPFHDPFFEMIAREV